MKVFCKIFKNVVLIATIVIIVCAAAIMCPKLFGYTPYIATSASMEPTIPTGSLVYIDTKTNDVSVDDIITFKVPTTKYKTVTHRVIKLSGDELVTKGDANKEADAKTVNKSQIVGKYAYHIPQLGLIYDKFGYKLFIVIAVWILIMNGLAILLSYLFVDRKEKQTLDIEESGKSESGAPINEVSEISD